MEKTKHHTHDGPGKAYRGLALHETVRNSDAEYVSGQAHVNGIERFSAELKRAYHRRFTTSAPSTSTRSSTSSRVVMVGARFTPSG